MSSSRSRICLITPGHVASAPRVVKEADTLAAAGFATHVVSGRTFAPADPFDAGIFAAARWSSTVVDCLGARSALSRQVWRRCARMALWAGSRGVGLAARAQNADTSRFVDAAAAVPADLYIGHTLGGLAAAAFAARRHHSRHGFDAEDFHDAETEAALADPINRVTIQSLQRALLPSCTHLTAASPLIGKQYYRDYGVIPTTVLNVFPRHHAPAQPRATEAISDARPARLYWFSQTIGPGRGLEAIVQVVGAMKTPADIYLRGFSSPGYETTLQQMAIDVGLRRPISFLPPAEPSEMARLASSADLGLSLEQPRPMNRDLCLTNKIFVYLLAGIPQLLSLTTAQRAIADELGLAALLLNPLDFRGTALALDQFFGDRTRVAAARHTAWDLAQRRFCWDVEQEVFLRSVRNALNASVRIENPSPDN